MNMPGRTGWSNYPPCWRRRAGQGSAHCGHAGRVLRPALGLPSWAAGGLTRFLPLSLRDGQPPTDCSRHLPVVNALVVGQRSTGGRNTVAPRTIGRKRCLTPSEVATRPPRAAATSRRLPGVVRKCDREVSTAKTAKLMASAGCGIMSKARGARG